jgi:hypothetical protein
MLKKIVVGTVLVGLIGILVLGGINRTLDKTGQVAEAQGQGFGRDRAQGESNGRGGYGQGGERNGTNERQYPNSQDAPEEWVMLEGTVVQTPAEGEELVIAIDGSKEVKVGTGPSYMAALGFTLQIGEMVQVQGYWEDSEFRAAQITRLADGETITLRDEVGRPAWAGRGRNAQAGRAGGAGPGYSDGAGQAEVDGWLQLQGTVASVDGDALVLKATSGEEIVVEGRPWQFAQEQGCSAQAGDQMTLTGFYEEGEPSTGLGQSSVYPAGQHFEVSRIENISSGQVILIRDEDGRPLWAGRGRRGG